MQIDGLLFHTHVIIRLRLEQGVVDGKEVA
jgi:hypothetical protein